MTDAPKPASSSTGPLILWLGLQLLVLGIIVARLPLAARYSAENLGIHLMFCAQVVGVGLTFPLLLRDVRCAVQILSTALPFQLGVTYLAGRGIAETLQATLFVASWIVVLALWSAAVRSDCSRAIAVATVSCLTLGGGILRYLQLEFSANPPEPGLESALPLLSTLNALEPGQSRNGWIFLGILTVSAIAILIVQHRRRVQSLESDKLSTVSSTPA